MQSYLHMVLLFVLCVLSGCLSLSAGGDRGTISGASFVDRTQVCTPNGCTDDPEVIRKKMTELYRKEYGGVWVATGSVISGAVCPTCQRGVLVDVYTQPWNFNPHDDNDDTPHEEDYGSCNNTYCQKFNSHVPVPGSNRPIRGRKSRKLPGTRRINNRQVVVFEDPPGTITYPNFLPLVPGVVPGYVAPPTFVAPQPLFVPGMIPIPVP